MHGKTNLNVCAEAASGYSLVCIHAIRHTLHVALGEPDGQENTRLCLHVKATVTVFPVN